MEVPVLPLSDVRSCLLQIANERSRAIPPQQKPRVLNTGGKVHFRNTPVSINAILKGKSRMAEREGFEPTVRFPVRSLSRRVLSTAQPPLRGRFVLFIIQIVRKCGYVWNSPYLKLMTMQAASGVPRKTIATAPPILPSQCQAQLPRDDSASRWSKSQSTSGTLHLSDHLPRILIEGREPE